MEQKCNSIFFGRGLYFPMKMLENPRALSVRSTVTQCWMVCSLLKQHKGLSQRPLSGLSLLLFRVPR